MKIYKVKSGIIIEREKDYRIIRDADWDTFINDDHLYEKILGKIGEVIKESSAKSIITDAVMAPIQNQEVWAAGVTYYSSKLGREAESKDTGGGSFYARVYEAERPEIFFKATSHRVVGPGQYVRIRRDSTWNVPEPELTLLISSSGKIIGYTIGNDMSSRSIEGENPLYLPQAKSYDGSTALGPCIYVTDMPLEKSVKIQLEVLRKGERVYEGVTDLSQIKRSFHDLAEFLFRECSFPYGSFLMTGTGIVPGPDFTLHHGDKILISIDEIGILHNEVR